MIRLRVRPISQGSCHGADRNSACLRAIQVLRLREDGFASLVTAYVLMGMPLLSASGVETKETETYATGYGVSHFVF